MKSFILVLIACCTISVGASAQPNAAGTWLGMLNAGAVKLRVVFHITGTGTALKGTMDSPDQGVKGIVIPSIKQEGDSLILSLGPAAYRGLLTNDSTMEGVLIQGQRFPVAMHKTEITARVRRQTPVPPFPYKSEDVVFTSEDKSISYGATITVPDDKRKHPALLLITGSGQQNRDEEIMEHKPFAVIADYLTRSGYIVLRVDDRGMGKTTGDLLHATSADFAEDAATALNYLKARPEVDVKKIGILGHSEGGMIATILAARRADIDFIISMAGPGETSLNTMLGQNDAIMQKQGKNEPTRKAYLLLYGNIIKSLVSNTSKDALDSAIEREVTAWRKATPDNIVLQTTGIKNAATQQTFVSSFSAQLNIPWFRYFIAYDPAPFIHKISCKVLALNGEKDIQVLAEPNLNGWRIGLKGSRAKSYTVKEVPGLNHLFQQCNRCDIDEYGELEQTISPTALSIVKEWLDKEVK